MLLHLFFTSNFKNDDKYLVPSEIFFAPSPPGCTGLAAALITKILLVVLFASFHTDYAVSNTMILKALQVK